MTMNGVGQPTRAIFAVAELLVNKCAYNSDLWSDLDEIWVADAE